ncbi:hypothetical protein NC653_040000 [Populus alba x Populus x berolinensis]|uniref:Uncharacterized protein n=1 Tax=Populus alba x Populus x berolinensis TaxID=444605 RepID=A0AAD6LE47_9ROSI|nr:hypothetical protein NC653_040000 [Populus alba x Populus x berolinensis]
MDGKDTLCPTLIIVEQEIMKSSNMSYMLGDIQITKRKLKLSQAKSKKKEKKPTKIFKRNMAGSDQAAQHSTEVLHQRRKLSLCPMKMAISGVALVSELEEAA